MTETTMKDAADAQEEENEEEIGFKEGFFALPSSEACTFSDTGTGSFECMSLRAYEFTAHDDDSFYWLSVKCTNCVFSGSLAFRKGHRYNDHECPKCENKTLERKDI